jgi:hypothetical protein
MRYLLLLLFLIICSTLSAAALKLPFAGSHSTRIVADTDTVFRKRSVSVGANYGSDIQFFGRTGPYTYPFLSADAIYNSKSGFFLYGSAVQVLGYDDIADELDLGAGYLYRYSKKFSGNISYTRFLFNKDAALVIRSASTNDINFKNSFDWKFAKSSLTFDYLFGELNDYFITISTSKNFESSFGIFDNKDYLTFNPTISAILGTQNFIQKFTTDHQLRFEEDNIFVPGNGTPGPEFNNGRFNALNYSVKLPIAYNRGHYTLEAAWKYSVPVNVENGLQNRHEVFFNLTFYYVFF